MDLESRLRQQLKTEAQQASVSEDSWRDIRSRFRRKRTQPRRIMVLVSTAALIVAVVLVVPRVVDDRDTVGEVVPSPSTSPSSTPVIIEDRSDVALRCFLNARVGRDFEAARECMSQRLVTSYTDPVEFIGPSSPSIQRFTILGNVENTTERKIVEVRAYIGTSTGLLSYTDDQIEVIEEAGRGIDDLVVDRWTRGEEQPVGTTRTIDVYFPPAEALCTDIDESHLSAVSRLVPATDDPALAALRELVTGPASTEAQGTYFPLEARVLSVDVTASGGSVRLNEAAVGGIPCVRAMNRAALEMTLQPFTDTDNLEVSPPLG